MASHPSRLQSSTPIDVRETELEVGRWMKLAHGRINAGSNGRRLSKRYESCSSATLRRRRQLYERTYGHSAARSVLTDGA